MEILCSSCKEKVDIMSIRKIKKNLVKVVFICPYCGEGKAVKEFLYED